MTKKLNMKPRDTYYYDEKLPHLEAKHKNSVLSFKIIVLFLKIRSGLSHSKKNIDLNITFKTPLIHIAIVVKILKQLSCDLLHYSLYISGTLAFLKIMQDINISVFELRDSQIKLNIVLHICQFRKNKVDEISRKK